MVVKQPAPLQRADDDEIDALLSRQAKTASRSERCDADNGDSTTGTSTVFQDLLNIYRRLDGTNDSSVAAPQDDDDDPDDEQEVDSSIL